MPYLFTICTIPLPGQKVQPPMSCPCPKERELLSNLKDNMVEKWKLPEPKKYTSFIRMCTTGTT